MPEKRPHINLLISLFLAILVFIPYHQTFDYDFVCYDDTKRITENQYVKDGINVESIVWSFSFADKGIVIWHPLTWLSHMLDCHLYGLDGGKHHLTSVILHMANSMLLFFAFRRMTGSLWKSMVVASLFAIHPINVDSVAWIAERKNVLSTMFWILTMITYSLYAERPGLRRYLLTLFVFSIGLLAKSMLVTLPFALLLLDYWPLGRINGITFPKAFRLIIEKIPLLVLSGASVYLTTFSLKRIGAVITTDFVSFQLRIANALVSYPSYIGKFLWPFNLSVHYPYPEMIPIWKVTFAGLFLILITTFVFLARKEKPYLQVGWLWFLGTLVPVSGLIQGGLWPAMADRWAYVPFIGLFIMIAWGIPDLLAQWSHRRTFMLSVSACILFILSVLTWNQIQYWKNSTSLFEHAIHITKNNSVAHYNLGVVMANQGRTAKAIDHFYDALKANPKLAEPHHNLGIAFSNQGKFDKAITHFSKALQTDPNFAEAHSGLGFALLMKGMTQEAIYHYSEALRIKPDFAEAQNGFGIVRAKQGKLDEAIQYFSRALQIDPNHSKAKQNLSTALALRNAEKGSNENPNK